MVDARLGDLRIVSEPLRHGSGEGIAAAEQHWDFAFRQALGQGIDHFAMEVDVEHRPVDMFGVENGKGLAETAGGADDTAAEAFNEFLKVKGDESVILDDQDTQT